MASVSGDESCPAVPEEDPDAIGFDTSVAHPARIWDYWLAGKDNFAADRVVGDHVLEAAPVVKDIAVADRAFLASVVHHLATDLGIRQFLDIGTAFRPSAIPTRLPRRPPRNHGSSTWTMIASDTPFVHYGRMPEPEWVDVEIVGRNIQFLLWPAGTDFEVDASDVEELNIKICIDALKAYSARIEAVIAQDEAIRIDLFVRLDAKKFAWEKPFFGIAINQTRDGSYVAQFASDHCHRQS